MPWATRKVKFCFSACNSAQDTNQVAQNPLQGSAADAGSRPVRSQHKQVPLRASESQPDDVQAPLILQPLPSAGHFMGLPNDEKSEVLETALQERLTLGDAGANVKAASVIMRKYHGQENMLYDMISSIGVQAVSEMSNLVDATMQSAATRQGVRISINDLIEVGEVNGDGVQDNSIVVKVRQITKHGGAVHVDGSLLSSLGKEHKLCEMFSAPATIRTVHKNDCDTLVLSHPAAKIAFERPSGTASFSCRKGHEGAMKRVERLKDEWEKCFQGMASKYCNAKLCLLSTGVCAACSGQEHMINVRSWSVIQECSLSGQAIEVYGDGKTGAKLRQACDQFLKERSKGANAPTGTK